MSYQDFDHKTNKLYGLLYSEGIHSYTGCDPGWSLYLCTSSKTRKRMATSMRGNSTQIVMYEFELNVKDIMKIARLLPYSGYQERTIKVNRRVKSKREMAEGLHLL